MNSLYSLLYWSGVDSGLNVIVKKYCITCHVLMIWNLLHEHIFLFEYYADPFEQCIYHISSFHKDPKNVKLLICTRGVSSI